jgi:hypothetical protein
MRKSQGSSTIGCATLKKSVENWLRSSGSWKIRSPIVPMQNFRSIGGHLASAAGLQRLLSKLVSRSLGPIRLLVNRKKTYNCCRKNRLIYISVPLNELKRLSNWWSRSKYEKITEFTRSQVNDSLVCSVIFGGRLHYLNDLRSIWNFAWVLLRT